MHLDFEGNELVEEGLPSIAEEFKIALVVYALS
jgi:hypothetical protein